MSALALLTAGSSATSGLPYVHLGALDIGIPIQWFGVIVAIGVLIGATPLRRYAEWHGVSDDQIRSLLTWILISGFLGAHEFDVIAYPHIDTGLVQPRWGWFPIALWPSNWPVVIRFWDGISSFGGFIGGGIGYALFVWWKRLPPRLFADITIVGLLPAFTIGRIACTLVSDHIGAAVDPNAWYSFLAMDYPRSLNLADLAVDNPGTSEFIRAWNLGLIEFLYLLPINIVVLWLAFRPSKRMPAGFITVLTGVLYAPVRFFLDFLRPEGTDPRHFGLTFAQWSAIAAFGVALYAASRILKTGTPAEPVTRTSREMQERLRIVLREDEDAQKQQAADKVAEAERKKAELAKARAERDREDAEIEAAERAAKAKAERATGASTAEAAATEADDADDEEDDAEPAVAVAAETEASTTSAPKAARPASKPAGKSSGGKSGGKSGKKKKTRR